MAFKIKKSKGKGRPKANYKGMKLYTIEGDTKVYGIEGVWYKVNRAIIDRGDGLILRNTYTGEERPISKKEAKKLLKEFNYKA